jgi:hypothetical protein
MLAAGRGSLETRAQARADARARADAEFARNGPCIGRRVRRALSFTHRNLTHLLGCPIDAPKDPVVFEILIAEEELKDQSHDAEREGKRDGPSNCEKNRLDRVGQGSSPTTIVRRVKPRNYLQTKSLL